MTRPSLRERKAQRTREAIVAAAVELFEEHGYDSTSVAQIAERAEVGTRTFFRYFADKEDVLFGGPDADDEVLTLIRSSLAPAGASDSPLSAAERSARAVLDRLCAQAGLLPARERIVAATPALRARQLLKHDRYVTVIEAELAQRHGLPPERAGLLGRVVFTCAVLAYERWCADPSAAAVGDQLERTLAEAAAVLAPFQA
ncbi:TetR family transcriptional regulator [Pseudonocardia aurantiaca]|uniref:TetR family transcriptional regulator n=1 Tax=Pseudonocardia aurantiaca TaxID=75290 RepID=A0ABW4FQ13_9PSEU